MIRLARDPVAFAAAFTFLLHTASPAQPVLWEMDAQRFSQKRLGEIRPRIESRFEPFFSSRSIESQGAAFVTKRPTVIDLGPFRDHTTISRQQAKPGE